MRAKSAVVVLLAIAVAIVLAATPASARLSGAVWTTTIDGAKVNANHYTEKCPPGWPPGDPAYVSPPPLVPYLNGGPQFAHPGSWLPDGLYYFQITDPAGKVLLSDDDIANRLFRVYTDAADGDKKKVEYPVADHLSDYTQPHHTGIDINTGIVTVAFCPFLDTPNNGGVYKLWVTSYDAYWANVGNPLARFGFLPKESKTDNFKVKQPLLATVCGRKVNTEDPAVGLVGLHITLSQWQGKGKTAGFARIADTVTGAEGWYSFSNLSIGRYLVCEDLPGTDAPSPDVIDDVEDYSDWTPVGATCLEFNITRADLGTKGKHATPGATIDLPWFVNEEPPFPAIAALAGLKFQDLDGNGCWDVATEPTLPGWDIVLSKKLGNGTWEYVATYATGLDGAFDFDDLPVPMTYRICETVKTGWLQTAPNTAPTEQVLWPAAGGDPCGTIVVTPPDADAIVTALNGCYVVNFGSTADLLSQVVGLNYGNKLGSICVQKLQAVTDTPLQGWKFNLYTDAACTTLAEDGFGNPVPEITTGADGKACWNNLLAGTYWIKETPALGWVTQDPVSGVQMVTLAPGQDMDDPPVTFHNRAKCVGLTPGFWKNWRNHYTDAQFLVLLQGTIAEGNIAAADAIFEPWPNYPSNEVDHVAAFLLACQLTINLTQHADYPNPSGGSLVPECVIPGVTGTLGSWLTQALAIWNAGGVGYTREEMTAVATALNAFCNSNLP